MTTETCPLLSVVVNVVVAVVAITKISETRGEVGLGIMGDEPELAGAAVTTAVVCPAPFPAADVAPAPVTTGVSKWYVRLGICSQKALRIDVADSISVPEPRSASLATAASARPWHAGPRPST